MFVKVCGVRTELEVSAAIAAGVDAVGFMFADSVRRISVSKARRLARQVPSGVLIVGVFRDWAVRKVDEVASAAGVSAIQLHGGYSREAFEELAGKRFELIRATSLEANTATIRVAGGQPADAAELTAGAYGEDYLLLDSQRPGSGRRWDLAMLGERRPVGRWLLAGGLTAANVAEAIAIARPWGVDVSSGVESSPGVKDARLIEDFVRAARAAVP